MNTNKLKLLFAVIALTAIPFVTGATSIRGSGFVMEIGDGYQFSTRMEKVTIDGDLDSRYKSHSISGTDFVMERGDGYTYFSGLGKVAIEDDLDFQYMASSAKHIQMEDVFPRHDYSS